MSWRPIQESGIAFELNGGEAEMTNSVVTPLSPTVGGWILSGLVEPANIRVTVHSYTATTESLFSNQAMFTWGLAGSQTNTTLNGSAFTPSQMLTPITQEDIGGDVGLIQYQRASADEGDMDESYAFLIEVEGADTCQELGRVTRCFVSGYDRARVHQSRLYASERRCLVANFNGAIPVGLTIASVKWQANQNWAVVMADAQIDGREVMVNITAQITGTAAIRCTVTLSNGERYTQLFNIWVRPQPYYLGDTYVLGPTLLEATA